MHLNDVVSWLGTVAKVIVPLTVGLVTLAWIWLQMRDHLRKQATRVSASKQRVNGRWHVIVRNPSDAPIRGVLLVLSDGEGPPAFTWIGWDEIPAGAEAAVDLEERFAQTFGWVFPLAEMYFTDARGKHWRRAGGKVRRQWKPTYSADEAEVRRQLERRRSSRRQMPGSLEARLGSPG